MTKIVFMGTPAFSAPILSMLVEEGYEVAAVVTQPDRPVGRKKVMTPPPVKEQAVLHGIEVLQPEKLKGSAEWERLQEINPDLIVTAAFGQLLPQEVLDLPRLGAINVHASLLPKYRGGAPIHQAVIDGEPTTGVTIMYMEKKLDAGDIISQVELPIEDTDTTGTLFDKLSAAGRELLKQTLPSIVAGTNPRTAQDEQQVTFARNISREQERLDWTKAARDLWNQVRGLSPWPGAYTTFQGTVVKIWSATPVRGKSGAAPGEIINSSGVFQVQTGDGNALEIQELQPAGKKKLSIEEFLRGVGQSYRVGDKFE
ncbi:methionyl-tRNA formyltransferase [Chryseomicrobium excrementi]|uniref:Methionyl-tRNA formyltransferase n=1 Tax=Chryseomicrobium excrementi TaxID=2041346 RepID=A0A2M9F378_9BACL|nr:methionyl-tRNA formyltransferase [Chryseomicrobium excrementi]PJK17917.1 methionyl-tRNA formyltransferase [Chryseomicrobium excrementi]